MKINFTKLINLLLAATVFLVPLIIVPFFTDIFDYGKLIFLVLTGFLIFVLWTIKSLVEKKIVTKKAVFLLPLTGMTLVAIISGIINSPNIIQSFISLNGAVVFLFLVLFYLYIINLGKKETVSFGLLASGTALSLVSLILSTGLLKLPLNFPSLGLSITNVFSPLGNLLGQTVWLAAMVPLAAAVAYESLVNKKNALAIIFFAVSIVSLAAIGMQINLLSTSAQPVILPKTISWSIAMDSLKTTKNALFGISPGQYVNAFTAFKPISFNSNPFWSLRFGTASYAFQLLADLGILGIIFYLLLLWKIVKNLVTVIRQNKPSPLALGVGISLIILLASQFYLPASLSLLFLFVALLALFDLTIKKEEFREIDLAPLKQTSLLFTIFPAILWGGLLFVGVKISFANHYYLNSLKATAANDGTRAYEQQIKAISTDPKTAQYRIAYSQTNFALANSLATKTDLTDNDRNTISQLVQQAIREAKTAVSLDNNSAYAWENLASLYQNLINFAEGADQWSIAAFQEAIRTDPANPALRLNLGGLYFSQKQYSQAATLFNQSAALKQDFANAHYNLANALRELGAFADAKSEYEVTQSLVKIDSDDYRKVTAELEEVKKRLPSPTPAAGQLAPETLSTPEQPAKGINPPLELPEEVSPETQPAQPVEVSPTP